MPTDGTLSQLTIPVLEEGTVINKTFDLPAGGGGNSKADKVENATNGNFAGLDANGNLTDSGKKPSDFLTQHQDITGKMDKANPTGTGSFSLNRKANTTVGTNSFAEGYGATASGSYSHAEGNITTASGYCSHAEGDSTTAGYRYQHVGGKYNSNKSTTLFEVGNGTGNSARSNAFEVYSDGTLSTDNGTTKVKLEDLTAADKSIYEVMGQNGAKNLFPLDLDAIKNTSGNTGGTWNGDAYTINGITYTFNGDGTITGNGTASANARIMLISDNGGGKSPCFLKPDTDYILSCENIMSIGGSNAGAILGINEWDGTQFVSSPTVGDYTGRNELKFTTKSSAIAKSMRALLEVKSGVTLNNFVFKPMVRLASDTDPTFQPYAMTNRELTDSAYKSKASRFCLRIDGDSGAWMDDYTRSFIGVTKTTTLQQLVQKFASADVRSVNLSIALNSASFTTSSAQVLQDVATLLGIMNASAGIGVIEIQCIDVTLGRLQVKFINVSNGYIKMCQTNSWAISGSVRTLPISYGQGLHITNNSLEADIHHLSVDNYSKYVAGTGSGYQYISINGTNKPITGTMYLEAGSYISSGSEIYFEFSDSSLINSNSVIDVYCDVPLVTPTQMVQSGSNLKVYFNASDNVTKCRVYIK